MPDAAKGYAAGRQRLKRIVEQTDTKAGRAFDVAIQVLIVFSLVTFSLDTLPDLAPGERAVLRQLEFATVMIFTAEIPAANFGRLEPAKIRFQFFRDH